MPLMNHGCLLVESQILCMSCQLIRRVTKNYHYHNGTNQQKNFQLR